MSKVVDGVGGGGKGATRVRVVGAAGESELTTS